MYMLQLNVFVLCLAAHEMVRGKFLNILNRPGRNNWCFHIYIFSRLQHSCIGKLMFCWCS